MNLKPLGTNKTELNLKEHGGHYGVRILFSYETPVAYSILTEQGRSFYRTEKRWSNTTTRHIKSWLPYDDATVLSQDEIEGFVQANVGVR